MLQALTYPPAELIWGLLSRGLGLTLLISFYSLSRQVLPVAGARGITPIAHALSAITRDFPGVARFFYFPSLLWLSSSDRMLAALPRLGMLAAASLVLGGAHAPLAFACCYVIYLSLDRAMTLVYPWDCLLFEACFWGMFLPATWLLPNVNATAAPLPIVAWVFRLLVLRVILGFGKHKFLGSKPQDAGFLKGFLANQPLPTPLGWHAQKLPMWVMKLGLVSMFIVEIPLPMAALFPGVWSSAAGAVLIGFMLLIWLTGNFGYFNLAMVVLTLSWLDNSTPQSLLQAFSPSTAWAGVSAGNMAVVALAMLHTGLAQLAFPFNTFCAQTFTLWPIWSRVRPRFLMWPFALLRALHPLRLVHAYGVFPPQSVPPGRLMPVIEASWDEQQFTPLRFAHAPTTESSRPTWCAPHHERFDQAVVYEGLGLNESSVFRNIVGRWDPYGYGGVPAARVLLRRILQGDVPGDGFYDRTLERAQGKPSVVRVRSYFFEPASREALRTQGHAFRRVPAGPHFAPLRLSDGEPHAQLPHPELWHYDDLVWLRRSALGQLMQRAERGEDPHALCLLHAGGLSQRDVARFWDELVPFAQPHAHTFQGVRARTLELRARYDHAQLQRLERIAARYALLLFARLDPAFVRAGIGPIFGFGKPPVDVPTQHHLRLLACHIVLQGRDVFDAVMREPMQANAQLASFTMFSGHCLRAHFRYEELVFQSQRLRALECFTKYAGRKPATASQQRAEAAITAVLRRVVGAVDIVDFLKTQFSGDEDVLDVPERWPRFALRDDDEVVRQELELGHGGHT